MDNIIVGQEILNYFPFNTLKSDILMIDSWRDREVEGWGNIYLPNFKGDGLIQFWSKDRIEKYIKEFEEEFNESPVFKLDPKGHWHSKSTITNQCYLDNRKEIYGRMAKVIRNFGTTE